VLSSIKGNLSASKLWEPEDEILDVFIKSLQPASETEKTNPHENEGEEKQGSIEKDPLFITPHHLVQSLNLIRYLSSREHKIRILHNLNYFRSIQRRLALDMREVGTRERALGCLDRLTYTNSYAEIVEIHRKEQQLKDKIMQ
jgi:hypothetical protein